MLQILNLLLSYFTINFLIKITLSFCLVLAIVYCMNIFIVSFALLKKNETCKCKKSTFAVVDVVVLYKSID